MAPRLTFSERLARYSKKEREDLILDTFRALRVSAPEAWEALVWLLQDFYYKPGLSTLLSPATPPEVRQYHAGVCYVTQALLGTLEAPELLVRSLEPEPPSESEVQEQAQFTQGLPAEDPEG